MGSACDLTVFSNPGDRVVGVEMVVLMMWRGLGRRETTDWFADG